MNLTDLVELVKQHKKNSNKNSNSNKKSHIKCGFFWLLIVKL